MPVVSNQTQRSPRSPPCEFDPPRPPDPAEVQRILSIQVPLIVRLACKTLPLADVLQLANGAILELGKNSEDPLHLLVNNKIIGEGEAVKVGENFGLRITAIGDLRDRLEALGR